MSTWLRIHLSIELSDAKERVLAAELLEWLARRGHRQFAVGIMGTSLRVPRLTLGLKGEKGVALRKDDYWSEENPHV